MNAKEWLNFVLDRSDLTEAELGQLFQDCKDERAQLEFKSGLELKKRDAAATVRDYGAAFGNADGGLLVFGYHEGAGKVDGVERVGKASPHAWAGDVLASMASQFSPPPRIVQVGAQGKDVLVIAFPRAPRPHHEHHQGRARLSLQGG